MLTTSERRRDPFTLAVLLSLLVHAFVLLAYLLLAPRLRPAPRTPPPPDQLAALSDTIRLEKRTVPRSAPPQIAPPPAALAPPARPAARIPPPAAAPQPPLVRIVRRAPPVPLPTAVEDGTPQPRASRSQVAYQPAPHPAHPNALT